MALSRTWYTRGNIAASDTSTAQKLASSHMWSLKECLIGGAGAGGTLRDTAGGTGAPPNSSKWVVEGSSDGATAGMDGNDRLAPGTYDDSKFLHNTAGSAHSWIVMKSVVAGTMTRVVYLLIAMDSTTNQNLTFVWSYNAFTGGSTTANPTSTNSVTHASNTQVCENVTTGHRFHYTVDANGNFFWMTSKNSAGFFNFTLWGLEFIDNDVSGGDTYLFLMTHHYVTSSPGVPHNSFQSQSTTRTFNNGATVTASCGKLVNAAGNDLSGSAGIGMNQTRAKWDLWDIPVYSTSASAQGIRGRLPDVKYLGAATVGSSDPATTAQERVAMGGIACPMGVVPTL